MSLPRGKIAIVKLSPYTLIICILQKRRKKLYLKKTSKKVWRGVKKGCTFASAFERRADK
jgi:hypothetical protein